MKLSRMEAIQIGGAMVSEVNGIAGNCRGSDHGKLILTCLW